METAEKEDIRFQKFVRTIRAKNSLLIPRRSPCGKYFYIKGNTYQNVYEADLFELKPSTKIPLCIAPEDLNKFMPWFYAQTKRSEELGKAEIQRALRHVLGFQK